MSRTAVAWCTLVTCSAVLGIAARLAKTAVLDGRHASEGELIVYVTALPILVIIATIIFSLQRKSAWGCFIASPTRSFCAALIAAFMYSLIDLIFDVDILNVILTILFGVLISGLIALCVKIALKREVPSSTEGLENE